MGAYRGQITKTFPILFLIILMSCNVGEEHHSISYDFKSSSVDESTVMSEIHRPDDELVMFVESESGDPVKIRCGICHSMLQPSKFTKQTKIFHKEIELRHGDLSCQSCHHRGLPISLVSEIENSELGNNPLKDNTSFINLPWNKDFYSKFHLGDGTKINASDVMELCSQCHGEKRNEYDHGAHGGMTGYWNRKKGTRSRLNCIDCHDAHAPKIPKFLAAPMPNYRFLYEK